MSESFNTCDFLKSGSVWLLYLALFIVLIALFEAFQFYEEFSYLHFPMPKFHTKGVALSEQSIRSLNLLLGGCFWPV